MSLFNLARNKLSHSKRKLTSLAQNIINDNDYKLANEIFKLIEAGKSVAEIQDKFVSAFNDTYRLELYGFDLYPLDIIAPNILSFNKWDLATFEKYISIYPNDEYILDFDDLETFGQDDPIGISFGDILRVKIPRLKYLTTQLSVIDYLEYVIRNPPVPEFDQSWLKFINQSIQMINFKYLSNKEVDLKARIVNSEGNFLYLIKYGLEYRSIDVSYGYN